MTLKECIFRKSYTHKKTKKLTMPDRCKKRKCTGYDDLDNPKCSLFVPILENKKNMKEINHTFHQENNSN